MRGRQRRSAVAVDSRRQSQVHQTGQSVASGLSGGAFGRGLLVENAERMGRFAGSGLAEEELSIEELDRAAGEYAPYAANII
jgi:hypothetical protein